MLKRKIRDLLDHHHFSTLLVYFINLGSAAALLVIIYSFWGISEYGIYAAFTANVYIFIQLINFGSSNSMLAELSKLDSDSKVQCLARYLVLTIRRAMLGTSLFLICAIGLSKLMKIPDSLSTLMPEIALFAFIGSINKTLTFFFTTNDYFPIYVRITIIRNVSLLLTFLASPLLSNFSSTFHLMIVSEFAMSILLLGLSRVGTGSFSLYSDQRQKVNFKESFFVSLNAFYFEIYPKFDFLIAQFFLSGSRLGVYALISTVNEATHALMMQFRTRITPSISNATKNMIERQYYLARTIAFWMLALIATSGFIYFYLFSQPHFDIFTAFMPVYLIMIACNFLLLKPFVLGFSYQQLGLEVRGSIVYYCHLFSSILVFSLSLIYFNITISWIFALVLTFSFRILTNRELRKLIN